MNNANAFGFSLFGFTLALLPVAIPGWFPANGFDGTSARALWLEIVGSAQVAIGAAWLGQAAISTFADRLATIEMPLLDRSRLARDDFRKQVVKG